MERPHTFLSNHWETDGIKVDEWIKYKRLSAGNDLPQLSGLDRWFMSPDITESHHESSFDGGLHAASVLHGSPNIQPPGSVLTQAWSLCHREKKNFFIKPSNVLIQCSKTRIPNKVNSLVQTSLSSQLSLFICPQTPSGGLIGARVGKHSWKNIRYCIITAVCQQKEWSAEGTRSEPVGAVNFRFNCKINSEPKIVDGRR